MKELTDEEIGRGICGTSTSSSLMCWRKSDGISVQMGFFLTTKTRRHKDLKPFFCSFGLFVTLW